MYAPIISLVLLFGLASCGGSRQLKAIAAAASTPSQTPTEVPAEAPPAPEAVEAAPILTEEEIQEILESAQPPMTGEAEVAIKHYTQAVGDGGGLSLTFSLTSGRADEFQAKLTDRLASVGATQLSNPAELYVIANSFAVTSAIEAGYEITPDLVARLASVALIYGQLPKEDLANLMYTILQSSGFAEQEIGKFLHHLLPLVPEYFAENFAASFTDAANQVGISKESALEAVASNLANGTKDFARKAMPATLTYAHDLVSDEEILDLITRFENSPHNEDFLAYVQELLEELLEDLEEIGISIEEEDPFDGELPDLVVHHGDDWVADNFPALDYGMDGITWQIGKTVKLSPIDIGTFITGNADTVLQDCEATPALPFGLFLVSDDCSVIGIPLEVGFGMHTITATNTDGGSVTDQLGIEILGSHPTLAYGSDTISVVVGSPIPDEIPAFTGTLDYGAEAHTGSCDLSPSHLPGGMWFDDYDCSIYGNPWEVWPLTTYTATFTNNFGNSDSDTIELEVLGSDPTLEYGSDLISVIVGSTFPDEVPADTGTLELGAEAWHDECVLSPPNLPGGMYFDDFDCRIGGQPWEVWPLTTYTATFTNSHGNSDSDTIQIEVLGSHPTLRYGSDLISVVVGSQVTDEVPAESGTFEYGAEASSGECLLSPDTLPGGLYFDDYDCRITGQPWEVWPRTTYTATFTNNYGNSDSDTFQVEVLGSHPTLRYGSNLISGIVDSPITDEVPADSGTFEYGAEASSGGCLLSPTTLPGGLYFDDYDCRITGQPWESWPRTTYTATFTNNYGNSDSDTIDIVVTPDLTDDTSSEFASGTMIGVEHQSGVLQLGIDFDCDGGPGGPQAVNCTTLEPSWAPKMTGMIAHYPFDAGFADQVNGLSLEVTDANLEYTGAKVGPGVLDLTAPSHSVKMPTSDISFDIADGEFSVAFWFMKTGGSGEIGRSLFSWTSSITGERTAFVYNDAGTEEGRLAIIDDDRIYGLNEYHFPAQKWHHFVATKSGSTITVYLNGLSHGNITSTSNYGEHFGAGDPIALGSYEDSGATSGPYLDGFLDELAVWNTALTEAEIKNLYDRQRAVQTGIFRSRTFDGESDIYWAGLGWRSTLPFYKPLIGDANGNQAADDDNETAAQYAALTGSDGLASHDGNDLQTDLVTYLSFDGPEGMLADQDVITDMAGALDFTVVGDSAEIVPGLFNQALKLDRSTDYLELDGLLYSPETVTVSLWFNINHSGPTTSSLWSMGDAVNIDVGPGVLKANYYNNGDSRIDFDSQDQYLHGAGWQHVVAVFDPGSADSRLYLNGQLVSENAMDIPIQYPSTVTRIGASGGGSPNNFTSGLIDELAVWSRGLRDEEVRQLYRRGANRLSVQVRACDEVNCTDNPVWLGPDGNPGADNSNVSGFSEQDNQLPSSASFKLDSFEGYANTPASQTTARYFQYRLILETDQPTSSPNVDSVSVSQ